MVFFNDIYLFGEFVNILVMKNGCDKKCLILCVCVIISLLFLESLFILRIVIMFFNFL